MIRYLKTQMSLMEAAIALSDAEEERTDAKDNYYEDDSHAAKVAESATALATATRAFAVECKRITSKEQP